MTIIATAEASIGTFMPTTIAALGAAEVGLEGPIADIEAKIVGAAAASASVEIQPPSLDLVAAIDGALQSPGASVSIESMLALGGELEADLGAIQGALTLVVGVQGSLGARVKFIATQGTTAQMATDIGGVFAGEGNASGLAVVLLAEESSSIAALKTLFGL